MVTDALPPVVEAVGFSASTVDGQVLLENISLRVPGKSVTAVIGPSLSGKSIFLRSINRLREENGDVVMCGKLLLNGEDVLRPDTDLGELRRRAGMVFSKPTLLMETIFDNVVLGPRMQGVRNRGELAEICESALREAGLWEKLSGRLAEPARLLPLEMQQRVCIARVLAGEPEVLLFDEPTASMDYPSAGLIENVIRELGRKYAVLVATQTAQQAAHLSDYTAFFYKGRMVECGRTTDVLTNPRSPETEAYVTGRML